MATTSDIRASAPALAISGMETILSPDGVRIAFQKTGSGTPLILVHGTTADHERWAPVLPGLDARFTVYAVDRRGRGGSGDADDYTIEAEFDDVAAVADSVGGPVDLLGHSYGALCSLEAALRIRHLRRLILYEPPIPTQGHTLYPREAIAKLRSLFDAGEREAMVSAFMQDIVHMPTHELQLLQASPAWQGRIAAAHTLLREVSASNAYVFHPERFRGLQIPALLMLGGDSPAFFGAAIEALHAALPNSRIVVMPGQQHAAMNTAPDLFNKEVLSFLAR